MAGNSCVSGRASGSPFRRMYREISEGDGQVLMWGVRSLFDFLIVAPAHIRRKFHHK